jgi:hypothetical protein
MEPIVLSWNRGLAVMAPSSKDGAGFSNHPR